MLCTPASTPGPSSSSPNGQMRTTSAYSCSSGATASFPFPGPSRTLYQREIYLRTLEQEREEILAEAYASRHSPTSASFITQGENDEDEDDDNMRFDDRGRQLTFRETVRQRQARLEFLRRQEFARRLAHRGLEDAKASAYAIKRLPPPRARPIERVNAAITIQRAYRVHRAVSGLKSITARVHTAASAFRSAASTSSSETYDAAWRAHANTLHELLRELSERTGVLQGSSSTGTPKEKEARLHYRVRAAAREAMESLRAELAQLDRTQLNGSFSSSSSARSSSPTTSSRYSYAVEEWSDSSSDSSYSDYDSDEDEDYVYTPPRLTTSLYVVEEEDEDEEQDTDEVVVSQNMLRLFSQSALHAKIQQRSRHSTRVSVPVSITGSPRIRSPVARSPSLDSIPEEDDL